MKHPIATPTRLPTSEIHHYNYLDPLSGSAPEKHTCFFTLSDPPSGGGTILL